MQKLPIHDTLAGEDCSVRMRTRRMAKMCLEQGLPPSLDPHDIELLRNGLHSLLVSTIQTLEEIGRTMCDVTNTGPWERTMDLGRQVWDKSRHVEIFLKLLERVEGYSGEYPETTAETSSAGRADDAMGQLIDLAQKIGDADIERALDFVLADENSRVRKDQAYAVA